MTVPLGKPKPASYKGGDRRSRSYHKEDDPKRITLAKRCKLMGWPCDEKHLSRADSEHMECEAGRDLECVGYDKDLWEVMKEIRLVYMRFYASMGVKPHASTAGVKVIPTAAEILDHEPVAPSPNPEVQHAMDLASKEAMLRIDGQMLKFIPDYASHVKGVLVYGEKPSAGFVPAVRSFYEQRKR